MLAGLNWATWYGGGLGASLADLESKKLGGTWREVSWTGMVDHSSKGAVRGLSDCLRSDENWNSYAASSWYLAASSTVSIQA